MAVVYEASDLLLDRKVAVKLLRQQFATDPAFLARFQREAKAAAGLSHPNVVAIYDVGTDADVQYIVMEMVEGRTLKEIIEAEAPLSTARIVDIGRQICEGLEYAHQHRIVHRDVKPQNILVTRDGRAKIADFGIAVALGASSLTEAGFVVGSAHYFSPEQAQGDPTTPYSDIYSTGVVLYEMATGRLPFQGETSVTVAMKQVQEQPVPPRTLNPRIPESLQTVILQAMAKDSEERFGSGAEMAEALLSCARAGMEATRPHAVVTPRHQDPRGQENKKETLPRQSPSTRQAPPSRAMAVPPPAWWRRGSSGWMVFLVIFAAFLCTLGAIPLGLLAYSNGMLGWLQQGQSTPTPEPTSPPVVGISPTQQPTRTPTPGVTPTPSTLEALQLVGMSFQTARQQGQALGLEVVMAGEAYDSQYPVNYVVSQKPTAGEQVEKGAQIDVVVSLGKEVSTVPRVVGDSLSVAQGKLQAAGFNWQVTEEPSDRVPAGTVLSQDPVAESKVAKGSEVALRVSNGPPKVVVPLLIGMTEAEAQDAITKAGLNKDSPNYQNYTTVPPGHVISQEPKPGTPVDKGTTVYIAVRKPNSPTPTPTPNQGSPKPPKNR